jgi:hypothetical protein
MHQDQGDASHVRAYAYAYGRLYIYGPLALDISTINPDIQEVKETSKVPLNSGHIGLIFLLTGSLWSNLSHFMLRYSLYYVVVESFTIFERIPGFVKNCQHGGIHTPGALLWQRLVPRNPVSFAYRGSRYSEAMKPISVSTIFLVD